MEDMIKLHYGSIEYGTIIPNRFIDNYMIEANGEFVKIFLYLIRKMQAHSTSISIDELAETFNYTERDIMRALTYWESVDMWQLEFTNDKLSDIWIVSEESEEASPEEIVTEEYESIVDEEDMKTFASDPEIVGLIFMCSTYLGKELTSNDIKCLYYWNRDYGFSADLMEYLVEYSVSIRNEDNPLKALAWLNNLAEVWHREGITTSDEAEVYEEESGFNQICSSVSKAFGLRGRNLATSEMEIISKWYYEWGFSKDMVSEACNRTINQIHQADYRYADKILSKWRKNKVFTKDSIKIADEIFEEDKAKKEVRKKKDRERKALNKSKSKVNAFNNFNQRQYDYDELEKMLIKN